MVSGNPSSPPPAQHTPERIVQELKELPAAPKVLPKLKRLLGDGNSSMEEIVSLIRIEPGIAARVLQVSNSAYYCKGGQRCSAVSEAIGRVGYDQVYEMVMHAVACQVLVRPLATYHLEADDLWRKSVTCGIAGEMLADLTGGNRETAYTLGLLHGVGMVAIDEWAQRHNSSLVMTPKGFPKEYTQSERALLGFTHADVGAILLKKWDFPIEMVSAVRFQYSPLVAGSGSSLACLVYAAKWMCETVYLEEGETIPLPDDLWLKPLRIDLKRLTLLSEDLKLRAEELKTLIQVEE